MSFVDYFGRRYLLTFPEDNRRLNLSKIQVNVVAVANCTVNLTSPIPGVNQSIAVDQSVGLAIDLPRSLFQTSLLKELKYVLVESDTDISVTVSKYSYDNSYHYAYGYLAVPTYRLGKSYLFSTMSSGMLSVTSLNDYTVIVITLTKEYFISVNGTKVKSLTLSLSKFESYQVLCDLNCQGYVEGSAQFSFLYGTYGEYSFKNSIDEAVQVIHSPVTFIVPVLETYCNLRCQAKSNLTVKFDKDNGRHGYEKSGKNAWAVEFKTSTYIISNKPTSCTYSEQGITTIIPPVKHYTNYYRFLTPSVAKFSHHAAIIIESFELNGIRVDHSSPTVEKQETVIADFKPYTVLYINVTFGQHEIIHIKPDVNFGVILYGYGDYGTAYAYPGGMKLN